MLVYCFCFYLYFFVLDDVFGIDEVSIYKGEWNDKTYAVSGEILDGVSNSVSNDL